MTDEKSKDTKTASGCSDFNCNPQDFKKMFEMMGKCCASKGGFSDCSGMMAGMMRPFSDQKSENSKARCEPQAK